MATSVAASEETEEHKRECRVLRSRSIRDGERIQSLLEEMAKKEEDFIEKLISLQEEKIELKCENRRLQEQVSRLKNKYDQEENEKKLAADSCHGFISTTPDNGPCKKRNYKQQKAQKPSGNGKEDLGSSRISRTNLKVWKTENDPSAVDVGLQSDHDSKSYTGRFPSTEEMECALKRAEKLKSKLSCYPSFIKKAVLSHVSSCFWLGIPSYFCKKYLPLDKMRMVLEDEKAVNYDAIFIGRKHALSGGWKRFALDHNLEYGDVLVFELTEPARFKVYIIKVKTESSEDAERQ